MSMACSQNGSGLKHLENRGVKLEGRLEQSAEIKWGRIPIGIREGA